jgi:hypothetical protein
MTFNTRVRLWIVAAFLGAGTMLMAMTPTKAGPIWDIPSNALATKYGTDYSVPDWTFTKSEFGNTDLGASLHLGADAVLEVIGGFTVDYNPATGEVKVWRPEGTNSEAKEAKTYPINSGCFGTYGLYESIGGVMTCIPGSSVGTASTSVYSVLDHTIPAQARSCTYTVNISGEGHTC